jgi:hypothetical protein
LFCLPTNFALYFSRLKMMETAPGWCNLWYQNFELKLTKSNNLWFLRSKWIVQSFNKNVHVVARRQTRNPVPARWLTVFATRDDVFRINFWFHAEWRNLDCRCWQEISIRKAT